MKKITYEEYQSFIKDKKMLSISRDNAKVLESEDKIIKIFPTRHRKYLQSDAYRFSNNVAKLKKLNIATVEILEEYHVVPENIFYSVYAPLAGITLKQHLKKFPRDRDILHKFAKYFAYLHGQGIYFRSVQFKNVIVQPNREFGLIDVAAMIVKKKPLNIWLRARNFQVYARKRYEEDLYNILQYNFGSFMKKYIKESNFTPLQRKFFLKILLIYNPKYISFMKGFGK